ncbi:uncharacterized protein LOC106466825 [Limulus polyphemus]|uniref:Uncharacterized protein LOC106466825 n=1 Tax=Limulus polyphemus TaxID=6850 RepID=A0ABM1BIB3_LIMPO|nr:uncharacterized protein LOC106466825 [Limulus polyphemus]
MPFVTNTNRRHQRAFSLTCRRPRLNNLFSIWYCVMAFVFQIYIIVNSIHQFIKHIALPWPVDDQPFVELNAYVAFIGAALILLPFFVVAGIIKVGNFPNDGGKWGRDADEDGAIYQNLRRAKPRRWLRMIWKHGGPTAPFLHVCTAFCLLLPRVLIQARLIQHGFLGKANLWNTDLDFMITHKDRLVTLKFLSTINETEVWGKEAAEQQLRPKAVTEDQLEDITPVSAEFLNYGLALFVYAVRYPSVFWKVNKSFTLFFSIQTVLTALQQLLAFTGFTVLYKVNMYGPTEVLLRFSPLLLNISQSLLLFFIYNMILMMSSSILYLYGLQKFHEFEEQKIQKRHVTWTEESRRLWGYIPHLSALLILLLVISISAPLMYDYTMVYCGSLDGAVFAGVIGTVMHLLLWVLLWLGLTVKQSWRFRTAKGQNCPLDCSGPRAANDCELEMLNDTKELPLLVIENGQTYHIREKTSKEAIIDIALMSTTREKSPDDNGDIYWLKPKFPLPKNTDGLPEEDRMSLPKISRKSSFSKEQKVTFEDRLPGSSLRRVRSLNSKTPSVIGKLRKPQVKFEECSDVNSDIGDYTTLRELIRTKDGGFERPSLKSMSPFRFNGSTRPLLDEGEYTLLLDNRRCSNRILAPVVVHNGLQSSPGNSTPHSTLSTDSGITKGHGDENNSRDNLTPRSGSNNEALDKAASDSSSGVHSNCSMADKRSSSLENIPAMDPPKFRWKSLSLQRTVAPPTGSDCTGGSTLLSSLLPNSTLYDNPYELTVGIRHPNNRVISGKNVGSRFGRTTNKRLTPVNDQSDYIEGPLLTNSVKNEATSFWTQHSTADGNELFSKNQFVGQPMHSERSALSEQKRRDSANYSLASSGDSDNSIPRC